MITAKDILEIRRTMKKDESSIVRMKGCYVADQYKRGKR